VIIRRLFAGHVAAGVPAHGIGVILVLDGHALAERRVSEVGHIAGGIDIWVTSAEQRIHDNAVVQLQASRLCQRDVRREPDPSNDAIDQQFAALRGSQSEVLTSTLQTFRRFAGQHFNSMLPIIPVQKGEYIQSEDAFSDPRSGEEHDNILPIHLQRRSNLRADEPATNDREALAALCQRTQPLIIRECPVIDHVIAAPLEAPWDAAGR
jgi:hypothetical protein